MGLAVEVYLFCFAYGDLAAQCKLPRVGYTSDRGMFVQGRRMLWDASSRCRRGRFARGCSLRGLGWLLAGLLCAAPASILAADGTAPHGAPGTELTHRMMVLMLQLGVILFVARLGGVLFERLRMPPVLGELCAGLLIGPHLLGGVPIAGFPDGLFFVPADVGLAGISVSPELYGIGALAAVVLLFLVGLETDLKLFIRYSLAGGLVGLGGVVLSFLAGNLLTVALAPGLVGRPLQFTDPLSLMMGIIFTATSVGIPSRILAEQRKLDTPEGVTILSGAVIDDVLGIVMLAVGLGVIAASANEGAGVQWSLVVEIAFKAVGIWLAATAVGLLAAYRVGALLKLFRHRTVIAVMSLGLALIIAGLFEEAGLAMIVGAYVTGLSLSRTDLRHVIVERLHVLQVMLVPVFFAVMGMLVDVRQLLSIRMLGFGLLYFAVATAAKLVGCGLPPLLVGFTFRGGLRIGTGMLPRGEVTLLMAGTALAAGVLTAEMLGIVVAMTLLSALISPPLMLWAFRGSRSGVRRTPAPSEDREIAFHFPSRAVVLMLVEKLVASFESEGFYVHAVDRQERLYQLRKEQIVMGFRGTGTNVVFTCQQREIAFVHTAMLEVVASLEQTIRELRKPLDAREIQRGLQSASASGSGPSRAQISLRTTLQPETLCPRLHSDTRAGVIEELLDQLASTGVVRDRAAALQAVLDREQSLSTGLQHGIAIPHARTDAVTQLGCAIGLKPEGVDFAALDNQRTQIIVLTLSPLIASGPYLQFISMISQVLNEQGRAALLACDSAEDMYAVLTGTDTRIRSRMGSLWSRGEAEAVWVSSLSPQRVATEMPQTSRDAVIDALLTLCADDESVRSVSDARHALLQREQAMSTGIGNGLALPHARTDAVDRMVTAVGVLHSGVDFGALDGELVRIVVLTLMPPSITSQYAAMVSTIVGALDAPGRQEMLAATSADAVLAVLTRG